jgi:hypothetical protein
LKEIPEKNEVLKIRIKIFDYGEEDNSTLIDAVRNEIDKKKQIEIVCEENSRFGKGYYQRLRFMISVVNREKMEFDYIDGGFTDWTSKLLSNQKERLLTSGIGTDFLLRTVKTKLSENS